LIISSCCSGQHAVVISGHPVTYNKHDGYLQYISGETNDMDSTYFIRIDAEFRMFRQLTFGETKIFDDLFSADENPGRLGRALIIIQDSTIISISNQKDLAKTLLKLPKPIAIEDGQTDLNIIKMLNKNSH
jgi:hypothetical protein